MGKSSTSIEYEFDFRPQPGEIAEILPGIRWLHLPLPFVLNHINAWVLNDDAGRVIVDTGLFVEGIRDTWRRLLASMPGDAPVSKILITHMHPDHVGCAGWLCKRLGSELHMTREEYFLCRVLVSDSEREAPEEGRAFYHKAGFSRQQLAHYVKGFGSFGKVVSDLPQSYQRLQEGQELEIGKNRWQVIIGRGHSLEHACLFCPDLNVLISGDQVLPTISPNVGVWPTEPASNPLADWFASLKHLRKLLPDDVLVLPSHGRPFRGVKHRLDELITEHEDCLARLTELCREPRRAVDVFPVLFKGAVNDGNLIMAVSEAIAHLNYLLAEGEISVDSDAHGVHWYQAV